MLIRLKGLDLIEMHINLTKIVYLPTFSRLFHLLWRLLFKSDELTLSISVYAHTYCWVCSNLDSLVGVPWMQGDLLKVKVNKLTSVKTQLPYSYYSLPYCKPEKIVDSAENLGEVLRGDRIENSPYVVMNLLQLPYDIWLVHWNKSFITKHCFSHSPCIQFKLREPQMCNVVCRITLDPKEAKEFKEKIDDAYRVNM